MRAADAPLTTAEIVVTMLAARGVAGEATKKQRQQLQGAVQTALRNYQGKGVQIAGPELPMRWILA